MTQDGPTIPLLGNVPDLSAPSWKPSPTFGPNVLLGEAFDVQRDDTFGLVGFKGVHNGSGENKSVVVAMTVEMAAALRDRLIELVPMDLDSALALVAKIEPDYGIGARMCQPSTVEP